MKTTNLTEARTLLALIAAAALLSPTPAAALAAARVTVQTPGQTFSGVGAAGAAAAPVMAAPTLSAPGLAASLPTVSVSLPAVKTAAQPVTAAAAQAAVPAAVSAAVIPMAAPAAVTAAKPAPAKAFEAAAQPVREVLSNMPDAAKAAPAASFKSGVALEDALTGKTSRTGTDAVLPAAGAALRGNLLARPGTSASFVAPRRVPPARAIAVAIPTPDNRALQLAVVGVGATIALLFLHAYLPAAAASLSLLLMTGSLARTPATAPQPAEDPQLAADIKEVSATLAKLRDEVGRVIVGQKDMVDSIIMAMIANEHVLLEGVPGVAKTTTVETFAAATGADAQVIQGTPDKMPADILGAEILQTDQATGQRVTKLEKGPIFAQFVLADEINRMMPKTQAALLQAMQSRKVSIGRETLPLPKPFLLLATMNPLEQEGVNVMPEAQLDRFMLKVIVPQPNREERKAINEINRKTEKPKAAQVVTLADLARATALAERVTMSEGVRDYIQDILDAAENPFKVGVGQQGLVAQAMLTRSSIMLEKAARIAALMDGRSYVTPADVRAVAPKILRHRIILSYAAGEMTTDALIAEILGAVPVRR